MWSQSVLLTFIAVAHGSQHLFSVHDDILAFPQYDIVFSDTFISETDAESSLAFAASRPAPTPQTTSGSTGRGTQKAELANRLEESDGDGEEQARADAQLRQEQASSYEVMILNDHEYLCSIPAIQASPKNETADAMARAEEEKELARATTRGWELLQEMQGNCMYFISGWWSYQFCYNDAVKQFHQLPPQKGVPMYPPVEDKSTPSYILGRVNRGGNNRPRGELSDGKSGIESTELQVKGEMRYLVQKLSAGTICDLTGKERKIEVQFHCHPQSADKIGWIKEVRTCSYLMVIYTPRLCNDIAFLPPRNNKAHPITCQEILSPDQIEGWKTRKSSEAAHNLLLHQPETQPTSNDNPNSNNNVVIGGVRIGAQTHVGREGRRISSGAVAGGPTSSNSQSNAHKAEGEILAQRAPKSGKIHRLSDEELKKMGIDPRTVEELKDELMALAGDKGWKLEVVEIENLGGGARGDVEGIRQIRGIIDSDDPESDSDVLEEQGKKREVGGQMVRKDGDGGGEKNSRPTVDSSDGDEHPPPPSAEEDGEEGTEEEYVVEDL